MQHEDYFERQIEELGKFLRALVYKLNRKVDNQSALEVFEEAQRSGKLKEDFKNGDLTQLGSERWTITNLDLLLETLILVAEEASGDERDIYRQRAKQVAEFAATQTNAVSVEREALLERLHNL